jgi:PAS domain S-box-containing protein
MGKTPPERNAKITRAEGQLAARYNPAVVYIAEGGGEYGGLYIAPDVRDMLGYPPERFTCEPGFYAAGIHPDDRDRVLANLARLEQTGSLVCEYRFRHADGSYRWVRDHIQLVPGSDGDPRRLVGFWFDITAERGCGEAPPAGGDRLRTVLDTTLDGILAIGADGTIELFNRAAERLFGYRAEEVIGQPVTLLMPDPRPKKGGRRLPGYLVGEPRPAGIGSEVRGWRKDGLALHLYLDVARTRTNGSTEFVVFARPVSAYRQTEAAQVEGHQHVLAILNGLRVGAVVVDEDDRVVFLSDTARRICNRPGGHGLGERWFECIPFDADSVARIKAVAGRPAPEREKVSVHFVPEGRVGIWLEVEVQDDPRAAHQKILLMYDVTDLHAARDILGQASAFEGMVGRSEAMRNVFQQVRDVAEGDWTVLIEGETGTGKELVAHAIHRLGHRREGPFVPLNAAGLTESVLASQLFGHTRGAFTGAMADHKGYFEAAEGGTLFLDEIGDIPMSVQGNLLRVLQEWEITRLGETMPRPVNVRVIAATHRDLAAEVKAGRFRADLFYRLRVARIHLPPLRERRDDIPLLVGHTLARLRLTTGKPVDSVEPDAMRRLTEYAWPGNVRELISAIRFAEICARGNFIHAADLPPEIAGAGAAAPGPDPAAGERERVLAALERAGGSRVRAAKLLGISRATLYRRLSELEVPPQNQEGTVSNETPDPPPGHTDLSH